MDKLKRYYGIMIFVFAVIVAGALFYVLDVTKWQECQNIKSDNEAKQTELERLQESSKVIRAKIAKLNASVSSSKKKIYAPAEADLGNDTLFFTLYSDLLEMVHANSVKIKSIDYKYNPESDIFFEHGKGNYFVCEVNMELISNYINLGKLVQDIYQYPYYIKINNLEVKPFEKDKKVLISNLKLRLYAQTSPETEKVVVEEPAMGQPAINP